MHAGNIYMYVNDLLFLLNHKFKAIVFYTIIITKSQLPF